MPIDSATTAHCCMLHDFNVLLIVVVIHFYSSRILIVLVAVVVKISALRSEVCRYILYNCVTPLKFMTL